MAISVSSRIRNAMMGLAVVLCFLFTGLIFLLVYIIEDQVFINQIKTEQLSYERFVTGTASTPTKQWQATNRSIRLLPSSEELPALLPAGLRERILNEHGVHEYFDEDHALFITHFVRPDNNQSYFFVYDVNDVLAVRNTKRTLFIMIGAVSFMIMGIAVMFARRLTKTTLAPVTRLSHELKHSDIDDVVIDMAQEFSKDEIGVLAQELAQALNRVKEAAQREFDFNRGVSHELRSPIQVAQSAVEILELQAQQQGNNTPRAVHRLQRAVVEMNEITEAFLWLASEREPGAADSCSVSTLHDTIASVQSGFAERTIGINTSVALEHRYPMPENVLAVVIRNLLRNAFAHGDDQPITVHFSEQQISISNTPHTESTDHAGYGVGLSIVQRICERFDCQMSASLNEQGLHIASLAFPNSKAH